mgnify:CR=1 FL=1
MAGTRLRKSRQRDTIYDVLVHDKTHPTAEVIYSHVREIIPDISLGTVYRNLNVLVENGYIRKLNIDGVTVHYDGNVTPHHHMVCTSCGKIVDIHIPHGAFDELVKDIEQEDQVHLTHVDLLFQGICNDCKDMKEDKENV